MQTTRGSRYRPSDLTIVNLLAADSRYLPYNSPIEVSHLLNDLTVFGNKSDPLIEPALAIEFRRFARQFPFAYVEAR
jgi:hypothetical protein